MAKNHGFHQLVVENNCQFYQSVAEKYHKFCQFVANLKRVNSWQKKLRILSITCGKKLQIWQIVCWKKITYFVNQSQKVLWNLSIHCWEKLQILPINSRFRQSVIEKYWKFCQWVTAEKTQILSIGCRKKIS